MSANANETLLAHHFENMEQQKDANLLGMWMFLSTEIMFFGGIFGAYAVYRQRCADGFVMGSELLWVWLGALNTAILIGSSLTMALAVRAAHLGKPAGLGVFGWLVATIIMGFAFLGVKGIEWTEDYREGLIPIPGLWHPEEAVAHKVHEKHEADVAAGRKDVHHAPVNLNHMKIFFSLYFAMTGLHALHMLIGFGILGTLTYYAWYGAYNPKYYTPVEIAGLYWHFVDIIWVFLFPLLYLIRH